MLLVMGEIKFYCPECRGKLGVDQKAAGLSVACPLCKELIPIPMKSTRLSTPPQKAEKNADAAAEKKLDPGVTQPIMLAGALSGNSEDFSASMFEQEGDALSTLFDEKADVPSPESIKSLKIIAAKLEKNKEVDAEQRRKIVSLEAQIDKLNTSLGRLEELETEHEQLKSETEQLKVVKRENSKLQHDVSNYKNQVEELLSKYKEINKGSEQSAKAHTALIDEKKKLINETVALNAAVEEQSKESLRLKNKCAELEKALTQSEADRSQNNTEQTDSREMLDELTKEHAALNEAHAALNEQHKIVSSEKEALSAQLIDIKNKFTAGSKEKEALEQQAAELKNTIKNLTAEQESLQQSVSNTVDAAAFNSLEEKYKEAASQVAALQNQVDELDAGAKEHSDSAKQFADEKGKLEKKVEKLKNENSSLIKRAKVHDGKTVPIDPVVTHDIVEAAEAEPEPKPRPSVKSEKDKNTKSERRRLAKVAKKNAYKANVDPHTPAVLTMPRSKTKSFLLSGAGVLGVLFMIATAVYLWWQQVDQSGTDELLVNPSGAKIYALPERLFPSETVPEVRFGEDIVIDGMSVQLSNPRLSPLTLVTILGESKQSEHDFFVMDVTLQNMEKKPLFLRQLWNNTVLELDEERKIRPVFVEGKMSFEKIEGLIEGGLIEPNASVSGLLVFNKPMSSTNKINLSIDPGIWKQLPSGRYLQVSRDKFSLDFVSEQIADFK